MLRSLALTCGLFFCFISFNIDWVAAKTKVKSCTVNGTTYFHSQAISSKDPNSHCLCITSHVYCRWEDNGTLHESTASLDRVTCFVMGKEYNIGEILPHSTGNCVECSCGEKGQIECSPRNCVASRAADISENFDISREHGIDENF